MPSQTDVEYLKNSLLYSMSLGSRELYHSNVWAWLIKQDPDFVKVFFEDFDGNAYNVLGADRECRHRDLIIWLQKKGATGEKEKYYYVIENKIKSLHSEEQLKGYSENLDKNVFLKGVFTGIKNTLPSDKLEIEKGDDKKFEWRFVDYKRIATEMLRIAKLSQSEQIKSRLAQIEEYCKIIESVDNILNSQLDKTANVLDYKCDDDMNKLSLNDIFVKLKGADFLNYMKKYETHFQALAPSGYKYKAEPSFHNGRATLDFKFDTDKDWKKYAQSLSIGIQLEGYQYRRFVSRNHHHNKDDIFHDFGDSGLWLDSTYDSTHNKSAKTIFGHGTSLKKPYDSYGKESDGYRFVYQYYKVDSKTTYDQLYNAIKDDLTIARKIIIDRGTDK